MEYFLSSSQNYESISDNVHHSDMLGPSHLSRFHYLKSIERSVQMKTIIDT
jgi:hypothetical protein